MESAKLQERELRAGEANEHTAATRLGWLAGQVRHGPSFLWRWEARFKGVRFLGRALFLGRPIISVASASRFVIGDGATIASAVRANPLGLSQPSVLRTMLSGAQLILGPRVGLSGTVLCAAASIEIGEGTICGAGTMILDNDFHVPSGEWDWELEKGKTARPVKLGRGVFVGARAIILKGVTIGDRAVIGAGAVVTKDVPAGSMAAGNPARVQPQRREKG
ncbi:MAG TPA: acyltransferase [Candidatus Binatia bacterium]|jgi:acetyltransferase-like isoleucine patch superfamily enzyme|nr:acyltransferase [Candidatus Binatia bacterium]